MNKLYDTTLYLAYDYLSMLLLQLTHISKRGLENNGTEAIGELDHTIDILQA